MYITLCRYLFSFLWSKFLEMECLDHMVDVCLIFFILNGLFLLYFSSMRYLFPPPYTLFHLYLPPPLYVILFSKLTFPFGHFCPPCTRTALPPYPRQHLLCSAFKLSHSNSCAVKSHCGLHYPQNQ